MRSFKNLLVFAPLALLACRSTTAVDGSGVLVESSRAVPAFHALSIAEGMQVEVATGPTSVTLDVDDNLAPLLATYVEDGVLVVEPTLRDHDLRHTAGARIRIVTPLLDDVSASGAATVVGESGADILAITATDSASVVLTGSARQVSIAATGGSFVDCRTPSAIADITSTDASRTRARVADRLSLTATGAAVVTVVGRPASREIVRTDAAQVVFVE